MKLLLPLRLGLAAVSMLAAAHAYAAAGIVPATDLHDDAASASAHHAVMLLFSLPGCAPCEEVERNYLAPLRHDPRYAGKVMIRKIDDLAGERMLVDFSGAPLSQRNLATRYKVHFAPTLIFVDARGAIIADPLIGADMAGFYGAYLDTSLASALRKIGRE